MKLYLQMSLLTMPLSYWSITEFEYLKGKNSLKKTIKINAIRELNTTINLKKGVHESKA